MNVVEACESVRWGWELRDTVGNKSNKGWQQFIILFHNRNSNTNPWKRKTERDAPKWGVEGEVQNQGIGYGFRVWHGNQIMCQNLSGECGIKLSNMQQHLTALDGYLSVSNLPVTSIITLLRTMTLTLLLIFYFPIK